MKLATIWALPVSPGSPASPAVAPAVAIVLDSGAALPVSALARIAGWPVAQAIGQLSLVELLGADPELDAFRQALAQADRKAIEAEAIPAPRFRFGPPIVRPGKVVGVGYNYLDHIREQGLGRPARPVLFSKFANAVIGPDAPIRHPSGTHALDLEAELAVVVGRRASRVEPELALEHLAGYTAANDVTARDWQGQAKALRPGEKGDGQWLRAKGSDTFLPLGPVLVTADELGDGGGLAVRSWVTRASAAKGAKGEAAKGEAEPFQMQDGNSSDLLFGVAQLVSIVSAEVTLDPGDVIITGTPSGVGVFREPPVFLEPGDLVAVEVERVGRLTNPIVDADGAAPEGSPAARFLAGRQPA
jgi:2-keto-4-pentenoate hydratase/2-oxohepta-3-ene-1,7-dioic acid hydratase in catechol pathway